MIVDHEVPSSNLGVGTILKSLESETSVLDGSRPSTRPEWQGRRGHAGHVADPARRVAGAAAQRASCSAIAVNIRSPNSRSALMRERFDAFCQLA